MKRNLHLLIIDPQNDFCDLPAEYLPVAASTPRQGPALPVPGAHADMLRLSNAIKDGGCGLTDITLTLDSHRHIGIERPGLWLHADGSLVGPYTIITEEAVLAGTYRTTDPEHMPRVLRYLRALADAGRYQLCIWPAHCTIGTWGHNVHPELRDACREWEALHLRPVAKVLKGSNPWTEHYSALQAEVADPDDSHTQLNTSLVARLALADQIFVGGEAGSHCVKSTVEHLVAALGPDDARRIALVTDCISSVPGFERQYEGFLSTMKALGVQTTTAAGMTKELNANATATTVYRSKP